MKAVIQGFWQSMPLGTAAISSSHRTNTVFFFVRDFERICCGETTFEQAVLVLAFQPVYRCYYLAFEHGRVCVATVRISQARLVIFLINFSLQFKGLYIFTFGPNTLVKAAFVQPSHNNPSARAHHSASCMQLTDRRIYFTWEYSRRRQDIPLFEDVENAQPPPPPATPILDLDFERLETTGQRNWQLGRFDNNSVGYIDFTLMPESYVGEI